MAEPKWSPVRTAILFVLFLAAAIQWPALARAALSHEVTDQLTSGKYIYIQSQRKDGSFSKPAEIWFFLQDGNVYVGSRRTTWRVKRIKAGHRAAKIHVQSASGPSFEANGEIVDDPAMWKKLFAAYAKKYAGDWTKYEKNFREGSADGSYVLIKYTPK